MGGTQDSNLWYNVAVIGVEEASGTTCDKPNPPDNMVRFHGGDAFPIPPGVKRCFTGGGGSTGVKYMDAQGGLCPTIKNQKVGCLVMTADMDLVVEFAIKPVEGASWSSVSKVASFVVRNPSAITCEQKRKDPSTPYCSLVEAGYFYGIGFSDSPASLGNSSAWTAGPISGTVTVPAKWSLGLCGDISAKGPTNGYTPALVVTKLEAKEKTPATTAARTFWR